jgi:thiosulfate/3-mercaptopyruvate sulfurtransferase
MAFTTLIDVAALRRLLGPAALPDSGAPDAGAAGTARPVLLDCRFDLAWPAAGREAYLRAHLPGAWYADLNLDLAGPISATSGRHPLPAPDALARRLAQFGIAPGVQVVAYDEANGAFAARAWWLLRWLGCTRVAVLDGGYRAWLAAGGELECGAPPPGASPPGGELGATAAPFTAVVDDAAAVSTAEVLRALGDPSRVLVDARAAERYAGTVEPIDPVAGHVPGAVNHPFADNLGTDGHFLAPAELRRRWEARLAGKSAENVILMCGSGVTACHDLLALEVAGLPGAKLYAGSWSEWIRDPSRPVSRGSAA